MTDLGLTVCSPFLPLPSSLFPLRSFLVPFSIAPRSSSIRSSFILRLFFDRSPLVYRRINGGITEDERRTIEELSRTDREAIENRSKNSPSLSSPYWFRIDLVSSTYRSRIDLVSNPYQVRIEYVSSTYRSRIILVSTFVLPSLNDTRMIQE